MRKNEESSNLENTCWSKAKPANMVLLFGLAGVRASVAHLAERPLVALITLTLVASAFASVVAHASAGRPAGLVGRLAVAGRALVPSVAYAFATEAPAVSCRQKRGVTSSPFTVVQLFAFVTVVTESKMFCSVAFRSHLHLGHLADNFTPSDLQRSIHTFTHRRQSPSWPGDSQLVGRRQGYSWLAQGHLYTRQPPG